ncbi:amidohydrolase [uncultured Holdemanella sp.]|uniref:amidohydrolase n=1 Tax=uncultured Holdemanella sp. TaxID=1763549 RepID=UPI0025CECD15|nr:amidohydrolase [uncultured Holdemanella sp.]
MRTRFYNAQVLTMKDLNIFSGEVWIEDNKISYVGKSKETSVHFDREIDVQNNLIMPGFINAHTHSGMTFLRSMADDMPLQQWLNEKVFPIEAKLTQDDIYYFSKLAILEYLTSGITTNFDMYLNPEAIVKASLDTKYRTVLCGAVNDFCLSVEDVERCFNEYNQENSLISYILGFSHEYTNSKEKIEQVAALSHKYKAPVYTHLSETEYEVSTCKEKTGLSPVEYLCDLGVYDYGGGAFHCVHMSEHDLDLFQEKHLNVVTNPASNLKLASGIAPIQSMLQRNINVCLGTDGAASNNCLDVFREMFLVTGLAKYKEKDASAVDAYEVLKMATINGAKALNLNCGVLEAGKLADLIILDLHQPNMQPMNNIAKNIVYSGSKSNVKCTMVNGEILYEDGRFHVGFDIASLYDEIQRRVERLTR